ncbi:hypothetical protein OC845_003164 [Tilletia horrida]|nr:hypothetical protein OC845_003164 [Tilletia horrida]
MKVSALIIAAPLLAAVAAEPKATPAPVQIAKRDGSLPTGTALNSIFSTVLNSYSQDLSSLVASITSAGMASASSLRAGTKTRTTSTFVSGTAASCILPSVSNNVAYCCPGGDIIDGKCYANGSGQFVDSTYFSQGSFHPPTSTSSSGSNQKGSANALVSGSGVASLAAAAAAAALGAAVLVL